MAFAFHLTVLMMNFLIALLSNTLATILKDRNAIMTAQRLNVALCEEFSALERMPTFLAAAYFRWMVPKYFIVEDGNVYLSRTTTADTST